jgi:soluble lytic murein transglycosylase-like protein
LVRAQIAMLCAASFVCSTLVLLGGDRGVDRAPFALPAPLLVQAPWNDEVTSFAKRLHKALGVPRSTALEFSGWILEAAKRQGLSPELLASVVFTESSFRKNVTSDMGAIGPAQVKPYWGMFCGSANLSDPAENIYCGAQILAHYRDLCGSEQCALSAYNVGLKNQQDDGYYQEVGSRYAQTIDRHVSRIAKTVL